MKKVFLCIFFIIAIIKAGAENIFDFSWNFGNIVVGINYSDDDDDNIELNVSLLSFTFEHKDTNIGLEINPIKYWDFYKFQDEVETKYNGERFSFINLNTYWDLIENKNIILGPFVSVNYLFVNTLNGINMNECIFSGGLRFSVKHEFIINLDNYDSKIIGAEIGYRNLFGNSKFYFSIYFDLMFGIILIGEGVRFDTQVKTYP